jgi:hypothetical protein
MENQQLRHSTTNGSEPVIYLNHDDPAPPANLRRASAVALPVLLRNAAATTESQLTPLSSGERRRRDECETIMCKGWDAFLEVGQALLTIRNQRLYREQYATFDDYCRQRWEYSKTHANRLIDAAVVAAILTPIGVKVNSESQLRSLSALSPKEIPDAWKRAEELAGGAQITAKIVRRAVEDFKTGPGPDPTLHVPRSTLPRRTTSSPALKLIDKIEKAARTNDLGTILAALKTLRKHLRNATH